MHRQSSIWRPFFDKSEADGGPGGGGADDDSGFSSDSASVAFTPAPDDTTVGTEGGLDGGPSEMSASAEGVNDGGEEVDGEEAAAAAAAEKPAAGKPAVEAKGPKQKKNVPLSERVATLKKEVDTLTHSKHKTNAELTADQDRLATVRRELADLEAKKRALATGAPAADPAKPGVTATADEGTDADQELPEYPDYRKFDTDEAYEAAVGVWKKEAAKVTRENAARLERRITSGVEARLEGHSSEARAKEVEGTVVATLDKVRTGKYAADWNEKAAALQGVQSAWYNPETHGQSRTPFLSDLSMSLLMQGREEGGDILHYLGSDPDKAQRLADLLPTRPLRDALVNAPSVIPLLEHFATDEGAEEFEQLKRMHPLRMNQALGALFSRLAPASSGSGATVKHTITKATPSARPPAGSPGARTGSGASNATPPPFEDWNAAEDARELAERKRAAGIAV